MLMKTGMNIKQAITETDIIKCYDVMQELRPHHSQDSFLAAIEQMTKEGYQLWYLEVENKPVCVAGFRISTTLYDGPIIDFDDFVTIVSARGKGYAAVLFDYLLSIAKENSIKTIHLNSAHHRFDAHRFYLNKKMKIIAHHFRLEV
jgi:GNAT superfamily N-acetyltransferase